MSGAPEAARVTPLRPAVAGTGLTMEGVSITRGGAQLLGPLDCAVSAGGVTVLMGANGAGKSLFLRLAHGLTPPDAGRVLWAGRPVAEARGDQGFVFQAPPLMRRSVWGNVEFALKARGWSRPLRHARTAEALARMRLTDRADAPAAALSGGERQRMALARAWAPGPRVMMLDEPSANLDPASTGAIEALLRELVADGVKLILSTHDIGQARRLAEEVIFLDAGRLAEQAPAARFFAAPGSEAAQRYLAGAL